MSSDEATPPIGHNRRLESEGERSALIEQVAIDLWLSRDDHSWEDAGDHWRGIFRELATTAVESVKKCEAT